jgi:solute:Na+ symporter, SSS family
MHPLDWAILIGSLVFIVSYGLWKGRENRDIKAYLLADKTMRWYSVLFSIMATQASAITFLSTPGQAYVDGMRFVQFYLGLPVAMVILSITAVPVFHRLGVYTAYEYLETRFDLKTRLMAAVLFLIQRGLAVGLTIYAPSIIFSNILGWDVTWTTILIGGLVVVYTTLGGTKAVSWTQFQQVIIIFFGMAVAFFMIVRLLPADVSLWDAARLAGKMGRLKTLDFSFNLNDRYTFWSGLIGGLFLQMSYFGTDQSQVQRYLTGKSIAHSRMGLLFNGLLKVPMQFFILFLGVMVFVFYQFQPAPLFFNSVEVKKVQSSPQKDAFANLQAQYQTAQMENKTAVYEMVHVLDQSDRGRIADAEIRLAGTRKQCAVIREQAIQTMRSVHPDMDPKDTNFIFLSFVCKFLPVGVIGLVLAAIVSASMSSTAAELNALTSTTIVDLYRRLFHPNGDARHFVWVSRLAMVFWGIFAVSFAGYASRLGSLIEAVNILGSLFYGTILGIFLVAFYFKRIRGTATFYAAILAELAVVVCFLFTSISFLWYNVVGCTVVVLGAWGISQVKNR